MPNHFTVLDWAVLSVYFCLTMGIGFWFWRKSRSSEGFTAAGRSLPGVGLRVVDLRNLPQQHQLPRPAGPLVLGQLEPVRLLAGDPDRDDHCGALVRAVLPPVHGGLGVCASGKTLRRLGPAVRQRVLPPHADRPHGRGHVPHGPSDAGHLRLGHLHRHPLHRRERHRLLAGRRDHRSNLGRRDPGHRPHGRGADLPGGDDAGHARGPGPGLRDRCRPGQVLARLVQPV